MFPYLLKMRELREGKRQHADLIRAGIERLELHELAQHIWQLRQPVAAHVQLLQQRKQSDLQRQSRELVVREVERAQLSDQAAELLRELVELAVREVQRACLPRHLVVLLQPGVAHFCRLLG